MPGRKIRCPLCSKSIYTRKRVIDGVKALVTGRDAVVADYQRSLFYLDPGTKATELSRFEVARSELKTRFGTDPLFNDVLWSLLNRELLETGGDRMLGLYRNVRFRMGEQRRLDGSPRAALQFFLQVLYLDINGPTNIGVGSGPAFDQDQSFVAPGLVALVKSVAAELGLATCDLRTEFLKAASAEQGIGCPVTPTEAWSRCEPHLQ